MAHSGPVGSTAPDDHRWEEPLAVLAVDGDGLALDRIQQALRRSPLVGPVTPAGGAAEALGLLGTGHFDLVVMDTDLPDLDGLHLAQVIGHFSDPPAVVFVTAEDGHALEAFGVGAVGYLLKPVDGAQLGEVLRRVRRRRRSPEPADPRDHFDVLAVDAPGRIMMVGRPEIAWVEAAGDYVRLHTFDGRSLLVRMSLARLEQAWRAEGFARVHRRYLVCLRAVSELRSDGQRTFVVLPRGCLLPVSRRHGREVRDRLTRRPGRSHSAPP